MRRIDKYLPDNLSKTITLAQSIINYAQSKMYPLLQNRTASILQQYLAKFGRCAYTTLKSLPRAQSVLSNLRVRLIGANS